MDDVIKGSVYIFTNPSFKGLVKIGYADDWEKRLKQLNSSEAVPYAFRAYAYYETISRLTDFEVHALIDNLDPDLRTIENFNGRKRVREFYAMSEEDAYGILECIAKISGTTHRLHRIKETEEEKKESAVAEETLKAARRPIFTFSAAHVPVGAEVVFVRDPSVVATVIDDRHIRYQNEVTSLSGLSYRLLGYSSAGPRFFTYQGLLLSDLFDKYQLDS